VLASHYRNNCSEIALDQHGTILSVDELDATLVLRAGGWDPRYAVTLAVASRDGVGAALIDSNGDEVDVDLDMYERDGDGVWQDGASSGVGDVGASVLGETAVAWGRAAPGVIVDVEYTGQRFSVVTAETGWWLFVALAVSGSDDIPVVLSP